MRKRRKFCRKKEKVLQEYGNFRLTVKLKIGGKLLKKEIILAGIKPIIEKEERRKDAVHFDGYVEFASKLVNANAFNKEVKMEG